jgi:hypothetical protein
MMNEPLWLSIVSASGAILTPILLAAVGFTITRRESRSSELVRVRIDYYQALIPDLNRLMCYMTFIGPWRDMSPPEAVALKRSLDTKFYCAAPLFSTEVSSAYDALMGQSFHTFGAWGDDAKIKSSSYQRERSWRHAGMSWQPEWHDFFVDRSQERISAVVLGDYRQAYDDLLARLVEDLSLSPTRSDYTTTRLALNAHAPTPRSV